MTRITLAGRPGITGEQREALRRAVDARRRVVAGLAVRASTLDDVAIDRAVLSDGRWWIRADLVTVTRLHEARVQAALRSLVNRGHVDKRKGTSRREKGAQVYRVRSHD